MKIEYLGKEINLGDEFKILGNNYYAGERLELIVGYNEYDHVYYKKSNGLYIPKYPPIIGYLITVVPANDYYSFYPSDANFVVLSNKNPFFDVSRKKNKILETYGEFERHIKEVLRLIRQEESYY